MKSFRLFLIGSIVAVISLGFMGSFAQSTIVINTDKASYGPGDLVSITGSVSGAPNQLVAIQVKDPAGNLISIRTVQTDSQGNFALTFKVPPTATSGNFEIDADAKINGQTISITKNFGQTVPEFGPLASVIFLAGIVSTVVLSIKIRSKIS